MALTVVKSEDLNKAPVSFSLDNFELDVLIHEKLHSKNILIFNSDLVNPDESDFEKVIMHGMEVFEKEFLMHHEQTILLFYERCIPSLIEFFKKNRDPKILMNSAELTMFITMFTGFISGINNFTGKTTNPHHDYLKENIRGLFSEEEFEKIIAYVVSLLKNFCNDVANTNKWLIEDIKSKKQQIEAYADFAKVLSEKKDTEDPEFKTAAQKVLDECSIDKHGDHNLWIMKKREMIGLLSPDKKLTVSIDNILHYLDIIFYGGYHFLPDLFSDKKEKEIRFFYSEYPI